MLQVFAEPEGVVVVDRRMHSGGHVLCSQALRQPIVNSQIMSETCPNLARTWPELSPNRVRKMSERCPKRLQGRQMSLFANFFFRDGKRCRPLSPCRKGA